MYSCSMCQDMRGNEDVMINHFISCHIKFDRYRYVIKKLVIFLAVLSFGFFSVCRFSQIYSIPITLNFIFRCKYCSFTGSDH